jgi:hypothetical protein
LWLLGYQKEPFIKKDRPEGLPFLIFNFLFRFILVVEKIARLTKASQLMIISNYSSISLELKGQNL